MAGEVTNIAEVANKVAEDIFHWFKWEKIEVMDENFKCHKVEQHKKTGKRKTTEKVSHTHPVDVVFRYFDPYLNKSVLLNTDLKSYSVSSITTAKIKEALTSLAKTIDCARSSSEWSGKYILDNVSYEVRGLLFIYNYDEKYDKNFLDHFKSIDTDKLSIKDNQIVHFIEPSRIRYLSTVVSDMNKLYAMNEFPREKYSFLYPDLYLHKAHGDPYEYPATIEMLCSPYMILKHGQFKVINEKTDVVETVCKDGGYVIYYNQDGSTEYEFIYLFDSLSRFQILSGNSTIKIRVAHHDPCKDIKSNYRKAINLYVSSWGYDDYKRKDLERIELEVVTKVVPNYNPGILAWRY